MKLIKNTRGRFCCVDKQIKSSHLGTYIFWHNLRGGFPPLFLYLQFCRYTLYDRFGNVTKQTNMSGLSETATYNLIGLPTSTTDRKGVTTTYTYNAYGSPLSVSTAGMDTITYTYNVNNVLLSAQQGNDVITYEYDSLGRLTKETGNGIIKTYQTDKVGNITYAEIAGVGTTYTYDNLNRMTGAAFEGGSASYTYDNAGRLTGETKGGITTTYTYNPAGWLSSKTNSDGINTDTYVLTYYADGNIHTKTENGTATTYVYDGKGQLTRENSTVYAYDYKGNRVMKADGEHCVTYGYSGDNQLTFEESDSFIKNLDYDDNGNLVRKEIYNKIYDELGVWSTVFVGTEEMTYDQLNRMTGYQAEGVTVSYTYGIDNMRRSKTVNGVTTNYLWDGGNIVAEADGNNTITNRYFRGVGLIASKIGGNVSYYQSNGHGDISKWGTVDYSYDAFGNETTETSGTNPFRYNGEYFDEESGFIYLRNRYYDSTNGRFTTEDPIQDGLNWYAYCANNPVMFVDPNGLSYYDVSWSEVWDAVTMVGVQDAYNIYKIAKTADRKAKQYATELNILGEVDNEVDAFRHFSWNYDCVKQGVPVNDLAEFTTNHEVRTQNCVGLDVNRIIYYKVTLASLMDLHNNQVGRYQATLSYNKGKEAKEVFKSVLIDGGIITSLEKVKSVWSIKEEWIFTDVNGTQYVLVEWGLEEKALDIKVADPNSIKWQ